MNFIKTQLNILKIKLNADWKKFIAIAVLMSTVGSLSWSLAPLSTFASSNPRFNIFTPYTHTQTYNKDYFLLDIKNETQNSNWNTSVSANAGDTLVFSVYYHNGVNETTAINTKLKVALPTNNGTSLTSTGYLWADNAENATASNPLTQTATINVSSSQNLSYITGSAKWYPNQTDWRTDSPASWPFGQTGDEIVGSSGVNIGNIQGCWEFSGYVIFKVKISTGNPALTISKNVKNNTFGQTSYADSTSANPNEEVSYQINVHSTGTATATNVKVRDILPNNMSFVSGTLKLDGVSITGNIFSEVNIGSIPVGDTKVITFSARVAGESNFPIGITTLINTAYAKADSVSEISDAATVNVSKSAPCLSIIKDVRNETSGETNYINLTTAHPKQEVSFRIQVKSTGEATANNVRIRDILPSRITFKTGTLKINGTSATGDLFSGSGININSIASGETKTITFTGTIAREASFVRGTTNLVNTAYTSADSISEISDTASVDVVYSGCSDEIYRPAGR